MALYRVHFVDHGDNIYLTQTSSIRTMPRQLRPRAELTHPVSGPGSNFGRMTDWCTVTGIWCDISLRTAKAGCAHLTYLLTKPPEVELR